MGERGSHLLSIALMMSRAILSASTSSTQVHERFLQGGVLDVTLNGRRCVIGEHVALSQDQKMGAHLFDDLQDVRAIENSFALLT